jgi:hypothetical protein
MACGSSCPPLCTLWALASLLSVPHGAGCSGWARRGWACCGCGLVGSPAPAAARRARSVTARSVTADEGPDSTRPAPVARTTNRPNGSNCHVMPLWLSWRILCGSASGVILPGGERVAALSGTDSRQAAAASGHLSRSGAEPLPSG